MTEHIVHTFEDIQFTPEQVRSMIDLLWRVWPNENYTAEQAIADFLKWQTEPLEQLQKCIHLIFDENDKVISHAESHVRVMFTPKGAIRLMALGGVCTDPDKRGLGLGSAVVRAAFSRVDKGEFPVCVFQTPAVKFYESLGAAVCPNNTWVDRKDKENPTAHPWEPGEALMYYPASFDWPEGEIDINGGQY